MIRADFAHRRALRCVKHPGIISGGSLCFTTLIRKVSLRCKHFNEQLILNYLLFTESHGSHLTKYHIDMLALTVMALMGITTCVALIAPHVSTMEHAQYFPQYNAQRVKIRYGPFTTQSMNLKNGMASFMDKNATMPCTDCVVTFMQAGLEYEDGSVADANTDLWLHHTVIYNKNRFPPVCNYPGHVDKIFAAGNERTPVDISGNG